MATGIKYDGKWTNRANMRKLISETPLDGALRDFIFQGLTDGAVPATVLDLVGGYALTNHGGTVQTINGKKNLVLALGNYADVLDLGAFPQPFTYVWVGTLAALVANGIIIASVATASTPTLGVQSGTSKFIEYGGSAVLAGPVADQTRHVIIGTYSGATSVLRVDGTEYNGVNIGAAGLTNARLGASQNLGSSVYQPHSVERFSILDHAATAAERAALYARLA